MAELFYKQTVFILAPVSKVWDALVNPQITPGYMFGCAVISDWTPGSNVAWKSITDNIEYVKGNLVTFNPEKELAFTVFDPNAGYVDAPVNYLTTRYQLSSMDAGTTVQVSQGDFSVVENGMKRFSETSIGWEMTLNSFKRLLES